MKKYCFNFLLVIIIVYTVGCMHNAHWHAHMHAHIGSYASAQWAEFKNGCRFILYRRLHLLETWFLIKRWFVDKRWSLFDVYTLFDKGSSVSCCHIWQSIIDWSHDAHVTDRSYRFGGYVCESLCVCMCQCMWWLCFPSTSPLVSILSGGGKSILWLSPSLEASLTVSQRNTGKGWACVYMCTIFIILSNHTRGHNGFAWKTLLAEKPLLLFIKSELKVF